ncbi:MAG: hypothetical protein EOP84_13895 [Verrucomicrobiaceae bacterium]|nr:MAG: hypothetical protein EOP84_13895 [Verrucomicrobiaceae bacterium]
MVSSSKQEITMSLKPVRVRRRRKPKPFLWGSPGVGKSVTVPALTPEQMADVAERFPGELAHLRAEVARLMQNGNR